MGDPIMMPVDERRAVDQMHIEAIRKLTDSIERLNEKMDSQGTAIHSIDTRLTRIEASRTDHDINEIRQSIVRVKARLELLEAESNQRKGAVSSFEWVARFGPWLLSFALAVLAIMGWERMP